MRRAFSRPQQVLLAYRSDEVAAVLAAAEDHGRRGGWAVGYLAYEAAPAFDRALRTHQPRSGQPLARFALYDSPDEPREPAPASAGGFRCGPWRLESSRAAVEAQVASIVRAIGDGRYYQVNLSARLEAAFEGEPGVLFQALRQTQPEAYCACLDGGDWQLLSVSPELFFDWTPSGELTTRPMKGTAPRHADPVRDAAARQGLRESDKERAENLMIVDLLRNDLSRLARPGSVTVPRLFEIEALPTAWQMTSTVRCQTRPGLGLADVFGALFPCGSVTGAPKVAAMAAIAEREVSPRGAYCGAIGLVAPGGHARFSVGIRTVSLDRGLARCGIGSGVTWDSRPADEYEEWLVKRRFLLRASAHFELLETLRLENGAYWLLPGHLARLGASAEHFGFAWDEGAVRQALETMAANHGAGTWRVRLLLDRQGRPRLEIFALEPTPPEIVIALAYGPVDSGDEFLRHKTTERGAYGSHEPQQGTFDTLLWNERSEITEFTRGNVVVELEGRRVTPFLIGGLLPGVLRADMLARGEIVEAVIRREDLARATGLWFINSVRGMLPARLESHAPVRILGDDSC
ncbi:aminodeoxychorismate synthase component I [Denitratisoma oestradiolicum]|uniref:Aminobenzoate synthetase n=1 Tax=Denitratisoma oestradiolicum TaxID=311182 RepID=A0A6S6XSY2_9PROT|nr:aminodeoxychorismate synthase component I [Denitratisoma oestradiolicum]CAB1367830.1 Aminobenzoate synthetase [Denitratisoma oestradiolicum]